MLFSWTLHYAVFVLLFFFFGITSSLWVSLVLLFFFVFVLASFFFLLNLYLFLLLFLSIYAGAVLVLFLFVFMIAEVAMEGGSVQGQTEAIYFGFLMGGVIHFWLWRKVQKCNFYSFLTVADYAYEEDIVFLSNFLYIESGFIFMLFGFVFFLALVGISDLSVVF